MKDPLSHHQHTAARTFFRVAGPIVFLVGLACAVTAFVSLITHDPMMSPGMGGPKYFWLGFVGLPLMFVGGVCCMFGYMGVVARYQGREMAPAAAPTAHEVAKGVQPGVKAIASAIRDGLTGEEDTTRACSACGAVNDDEARFCDACGESMAAERGCPSCGQANDPEARFCDACGVSLSGA